MELKSNNRTLVLTVMSAVIESLACAVIFLINITDTFISFVWVCFQDQGLTCNEVTMQTQVKFDNCESLVLIKFSLKDT